MQALPNADLNLSHHEKPNTRTANTDLSSQISPVSTQQSVVSSMWKHQHGDGWLTEAVTFSRGKQ